MNWPDDFIDKVICGDCRDILPLIPDGAVDLVVTDPPYGINYKSNRQGYCGRSGKDQKTGRVYFEKIQQDETLETGWLVECFRIMSEGGALYSFCHWSRWGQFSKAVEAAGFKVKNMIIMNKTRSGMGDLKGAYAPKHELLLFASKGRHLLSGESRPDDVWDAPVLFTASIRPHPNRKPEKWILPAIINSSSEQGLILDPFLGSGTTAVAAKNMGRRFIGIEVEPKYCEIAERRLKQGVLDLGGR